MERLLLSRDLLSLVGKGEDAPAPPPEQRRDEMEEDEVNLALALSLGSGIDDKKGDKIPRSSSAAALTMPAEVPVPPALPRTSSNSLPQIQAEDHAPRLSASESPSSASLEGDAHRLQVDNNRKKEDNLPRSSSTAALTTPVEVPAPPPLPRTSSVPVQVEERHAPRLPASESRYSASLEGDGQRLQACTLMSTRSLPAVTNAAGKGEYKKRKEEQSLTKRLEANKKKMMIERRNSTCSTSEEAAGQVVPQEMNAHTAGKLVSCDEAVVGNNENQSSGMDLAPKRRRGRPPKYQVTLTSQHGLSAGAGKKPNSGFKGTAVTMEPRSSSVPSSSEAIRRVTAASPLPPSSLAPIRTAAAATLGSSSRGDQTILGRVTATRANSMVDDVGRRLMQEMPAVHTKDLPNSNRVNGFLYKYRKADDVKIVCICHGSFFTPSEFLEHAGAGNGKIVNPLRHIVVSPSPSLQ